MKNIIPLSTILLAAAVCADPADPQISNVRLEQNSVSRRVTVRYDLDEAAVVTMDVLTNGVSIGGANIQAVGGDCFKKVVAGNNHVVTWDPHLSWPDHKFGAGVVSVRMTAWALDNTPDYMAVDITATGGADTQTYYPAADFVPGGVTNSIYKTTKLLMRKIMAKDVEWTMGSTTLETQNRQAAREATHQVTLTNNYYIGVYEVTQAQWDLIQPSRTAPSYFNNAVDRAMRPVEQVSYNEIRNSNNSTTADATYNWPADPNPKRRHEVGRRLGHPKCRRGREPQAAWPLRAQRRKSAERVVLRQPRAVVWSDERHGHRRKLSSERLGDLRHAWQRVGVVPRLVRGQHQRERRRGEHRPLRPCEDALRCVGREPRDTERELELRGGHVPAGVS